MLAHQLGVGQRREELERAATAAFELGRQGRPQVVHDADRRRRRAARLRADGSHTWNDITGTSVPFVGRGAARASEAVPPASF
jgi:NADPH-dependent 2,4-dienoyl-CoA reductase/sulfur reductase-like enzyme